MFLVKERILYFHKKVYLHWNLFHNTVRYLYNKLRLSVQKKQALLMDATLMVRVASKEYVAVMSGLDAESMYWTDSKTYTQKHVNIRPRFENIRILLYY